LYLISVSLQLTYNYSDWGGMLGNGARFLGPSAGSTNNINNQHQTHYNRSIWPTATTTFQANGSECKSKILLFILYRIFFCILCYFAFVLNSSRYFSFCSPEKKSSFPLQKQKCNNKSMKCWKNCLSAYTNFKQNIFCTLLMQTKFMQAPSSFSFWTWCQWTLFHQH